MPAPLRIYGIPQSRAFRTLWAAEELGLAYERIDLAFDATGTKSPGFLKINPNGKVPAIDSDGFVLWESLAINLYLSKKHAAGNLYPTRLEDEAKLWQWSFWAAHELEPPLVAWAMHTTFLPPEERDPKAVAAALERLPAPLAVLEGALAERPYLLGDAFTVADLNVASICYRLVAMRHPTGSRVAAWLERCYARPAAQAARRLREAR